MAVTRVTTTMGQVFDVAATYDDLTAYLAPRRMTQDDGEREVRLVDGRRVTINRAIVATREEVEKRERRAVGFR